MDTPRRSRLVCAVLAAAAVLAAFAAGAQQSEQDAAAQEPEEPARGFADRISVSWVLVPVLVRERGGGFVDDLEREDFRLLVDGEPVAIESFDRGRDAPVSLVVLQDLSGSMDNGGKIEASRRAVEDLIERSRPGDELALASFAGGRLAVDVPFTSNRGALGEAMALWHPYGTTALHDAVAWIPSIGAEGRHPKRAVVLVSDGVDNASTVTPETARQVVRDAQLPVYVLGLGRHDAAPGNGDGGGGGATYARLLTDLALATGGSYYQVAPGEEVFRAAANLLEQLRRQYVLAFPTRAGDAGYRRIRVEVTADDRFTVYHRRGYRGGPPAAGPS